MCCKVEIIIIIILQGVCLCCHLSSRNSVSCGHSPAASRVTLGSSEHSCEGGRGCGHDIVGNCDSHRSVEKSGVLCTHEQDSSCSSVGPI